MNEIFADRIQSVTLVNGVVRIQLAQMRANAPGQQSLSAEAAGVLLVPAAAFRDFAAQIGSGWQRMAQALAGQQGQARGAAAPAGEPGRGSTGSDEALAKL